MGYRIQQEVHSPSPQPLSPNNVYHNQSNTPSPYRYDRISPDIANIYNATPPPAQQPSQNQFLGAPPMSMSYNFQSNNLNPPFQSMPTSSNDWLGNDPYGLMQFNNLNAANTHQQQQHMHQQQQQQQQSQHQTQSQTQNIPDSNLNIVGDSHIDAPTASGLMDIDSGQLLNINSTEIMSNLSLT